MSLYIDWKEERDYVIYKPLSPDLVRNAQMVVCGLASDAEDASFLLTVLGLKGA